MVNHTSPLNLMFQALADPTRRAIVEHLCGGPASVSELAKPAAMSMPAIMQHLRVLEASGLIQSEKTGRVRTCRIAPDALSPAERWLSDRRTGWQRNLDRLGEHLAATANEPQEDNPS